MQIMVLRGIRHKLRMIVIRRSPAFAVAYRAFRAYSKFQKNRPLVTQFGFKFAGSIHEDGEFGFEEAELMEKYLRECDVFIDVGANLGFYSCMARSMGKKVIAIEPLDENLSYLMQNLRLNGWTDMEVWPIGLACEPGLATMHGDGAFASLIEGWAGNFEAWKRRIPLNTLDNVVGERFQDKKIVIKVDVEGSEFEALKGAYKVLSRLPRPVWFIEIHLHLQHPRGNSEFEKTFNLFWQNGYEVITADKNRQLITRADVNRWSKNGVTDFGTYNYCFTPKVAP